ncbi:MAG: C39 family peptidase, partial [Candidatus Aenigmarchaeota archaeon]|nr:C39 family peptidase [Candidatus Aenigmarchaeota archaeon]
MEKKKILLLATAVLLLTATFPISSVQLSTEKDLGIQPLFQHKDTRMLCLRGCPLYGKHAWDSVHEVNSSDDVASCDHCKSYCAVASIAMINHYYGGNISQDRIINFLYREVYHQNPENDLAHWGVSVDMTTKALSWALNGAEIYHEGYPNPWPFPKPSLEQIKQWIDSGRPILRQWLAHDTVIDGYDGEYLHVINPWTGTESRIHYNDLDMYNRWIPPAN